MAQVVYPVWRISINGTCEGQSIVNVFHIDGQAAAGGNEVAQAIGEAFATHFGPVLSSSYVFGEAAAMWLGDPNGGTGNHSLSTFENGDAGPAAEVGLAAVIQWRTDASGRRIRPGRTFLGPLNTSAFQNTGLEVDAGTRADINAAADAFLASIVGVGAQLVILHGAGDGGSSGIVMGRVVSGECQLRSGHLDSRRS